MISGIGIDIVKVKRFRNNLDLVNRILHSEEIKIYQELQNKREKQKFLAGRWAVKEAIFKALNQTQNISLKSINIKVKDKKLVWVGNENKSWVSISHEEEFAVGMAVLSN